MKAAWEKPMFETVNVNGECTAYAGTETRAVMPDVNRPDPVASVGTERAVAVGTISDQ